MQPLEQSLRILEIGSGAELCGRYLADAGADVILVEQPASGARMRRVGPFVRDEATTESSLSHAYYNSNKRSVTLDVETADGLALWRKLVASADVVIDASGPGILDEVGAGYDDFPEHEGLVWCSVTPFGVTGPWRDLAATDLINMALGGPMMSTGYSDHDLPPIRAEGWHSMAMASEYAMMAILAALYERRSSGKGDFIDVSAHEAISATVEGAFPNWEYMGELVQRQTGRHASVTPTPAWQVKCADGGYVNLMGGGIPRDTRVYDRLIEWMKEHNAHEDLEDEKYRQAIFQGPRGQGPERIHIQETIAKFAESLPAEDVYRGGQALHLPWAKIRRPEENLDDPHWEDRGFFFEVEVNGVEQPIKIPGAPYRFSRTPLASNRRAPMLGEHNYEIYSKELGVPAAHLPILAGQEVI
ncbi:MAG: CoA transferase [Chloroflexi bacterium]|nr:CoA transferase [Chloroflexota bacterium]